MSYDTFYFIVFLALTWVLFRILPWRGWILLASSIVFYTVAGIHDTMVATAIILGNYVFQFLILRDRRFLYAALVLNFGCLAYFKYRVFLAGAAGIDLFAEGIVIPLGISFYIFQLSAFLVDIARGKAEPFRSLAKFTLFKLFFGQLVAGPIMRWRKFGPQIDRLFDRGAARPILLTVGLGLCTLGLFKKIILADSLAPIVDRIFEQGPADAAVAWLGAWLFGFQIYLDFSAYSEIALGLGYLFGLRLSLNFRQPYLTRTPTAFWRHWHITLSRWIRDYLYIPLGGGRGSTVRQLAVLFLVMALAGLWHGPNWTFIVWGLGWAVLTVLWRVFGATLARLGPAEWVLHIVLVMILWVFFRAANITDATQYLATMFGGGGSGAASFPTDGYGGLMIAAGCALLLAFHGFERLLMSRRAMGMLVRHDGAFLRAFFIGICVLLVLIPKTNTNPFIYFRF